MAARGPRAAFPTWLPWLTWGLAASFFCYGFFHRVAPSVIIDSLMRDLQVGGAVLGNLSAFYFYAYAVLQVPVGLMADRWGPRRMITFGALLCAAGSLVFASAESLGLAYAGRLMIGAGSGFGFVCALKLAVSWFPPERFSRVSSFTMMIGMLGGVAGQAPLAALVESFGWRSTLNFMALVGVLLAAAIWLVVRDGPTSEPTEPRHRPAVAASPFATLLAVLGRPANWLVALACAAVSAPLLAFAGLWGVAWLMQIYGYGRTEAAATTSMLLFGLAGGAPLFGWLAERLACHRPLLIAALAGATATLAALILIPALPGHILSLLFLLCGVSAGGVVLGFAALRVINPPETTGAAFGFVNMSIVSTGAIFQPLIGWLLDLGWDGATLAGARVYSNEAYGFALPVLLLFLGCGLAATLALRESHPTRRH